MEIIINGQLACLKKNTSFEYISENSMFTGSDSYTLTITFPLKDCPQNIAIFGHIHRQDVEKSKVVFDCDIRDKGFFKSGSITITQISETEVKTQFLEGRSEQNFDDTFDDIYLNQLHLGYPDADSRNSQRVYPEEVWWDCYPGCDWVALPWVNNTSGNMQNQVTKDEYGNYIWSGSRSFSITYQPFLLYILNKICEVMGYTGDFSSIENSKFQYLLICNTLPYTWGAWNFAIALPHWTLTEFFEQLELLMDGEFAINHKAKTIGFEFSHKIAKKTQPVRIDKVVNKYTVEVSRDSKSEYKGVTNLAYADNDNRMWAYRSCQWYIDEHKKEAMVFETLNELLEYASTLKQCGVQEWTSGNRHSASYTRGYPGNSDGHKLFYAEDVDTYFIMWCYKSEFYKSFHIYSTDSDYNYYIYTNRLMPVNQFGKKVVDKDAEEVELNIVPAWIDYTDENLGQCMFLECGEMGSAESWTEETDENGNTSGGFNPGSGGGSFGGGGRRVRSSGTSFGRGDADDDTDYNSGALAQTNAGRAIAKGEQDKNDAYFDKIYVGFWDGLDRHPGKVPYPIVDSVEVTDDFREITTPYSLRINKKEEVDANGQPMNYVYRIDSKKKYNFSFLSDEIPDPRAVFYIDGGKYVCEKITATFHEGTGKSQLLKGVFYKII
jgi:uncharacterized membrane protein YgcG